MTFGQKLKRYREENGLTQELLAEILGTHKQNICRFEKEHITPKVRNFWGAYHNCVFSSH